MAKKRNKKSTRLAPRPVKGKGTPLSAETRARLEDVSAAFVDVPVMWQTITALAKDHPDADVLDVPRLIRERAARPYPKGGATPTPDDVIAEIRAQLYYVRQARPGEKDYKLYAFVAGKCHVSPGTVRKYDLHPRARRRQ